MCTGIVENRKLSGSGKGPSEWFPIDHASISYDHPDHAQTQQAVIIDIFGKTGDTDSRIAVELTPESARDLVNAILTSMSRGQES